MKYLSQKFVSGYHRNTRLAVSQLRITPILYWCRVSDEVSIMRTEFLTQLSIQNNRMYVTNGKQVHGVNVVNRVVQVHLKIAPLFAWHDRTAEKLTMLMIAIAKKQ